MQLQKTHTETEKWEGNRERSTSTPNEANTSAIHNEQQKRKELQISSLCWSDVYINTANFSIRERSGDKWEARERVRDPHNETQKIRISIWRNHTCDKANSIKASLWRKLTSAVQINPFWRLRILYLIGQHTNEAISIATPNAGALITGHGCQGNSIRVSEGANEENMELSWPPHTPN